MDSREAVTFNDLEFRITDSGNAEKLEIKHGRDFLFCEPLGGWLHWEGMRWKLDNAAIWRAAKEIGTAIQHEAAETSDRGEAERLWRHGRYSLGKAGLKNMIEIAEKSETFRVGPGVFDADPYLFNVLNGTLDLRSGQLRPHSRDDLLTKVAPVSYDPTATAPIFQSFLERVLPDAEVRKYLSKVTGRALAGDTERREFYLNQGVGSNGKNTLYDSLLSLFGDYGTALSIDVLMEKRKGSDASPDLVQLKGKRFVVSSESDHGSLLKAGLIKRLTGDEFITARALYKEPITFERTFSMFMHVNHKPYITDTGYAMWNRVRMIPWTVTITGSEKDTKLKNKLDTERSGILNWLLIGYSHYEREGLAPPQAIMAATNQYQDEQNKAKRFISERCIFPEQPGLLPDEMYVTKTDLYQEYRNWCEGEGIYPESKSKFSDHMVEQGFDPDHRKRMKGKQERVWFGIGLTHG